MAIAYEDGVSVPEQVGFKNHDTYPANVHRFISMNDNRLHGTAKQKWRNSGLDHSDDVKSCLALLSYLDQNIIEWGKCWFNRYLWNLRSRKWESSFPRREKKKSHLHKSWMRAYRNTLPQNDKDH